MLRRSVSAVVNQTNQRIQVFARCRPLNTNELEQCSPSVVEVVPDENKLVVKGRKTLREYSFDDVFHPESDQIAVYKAVAEPLIHEVLLGYNCTVFAYGQTGTGKTYTMEGGRSNAECKWDDDSAAGIIPRSMYQLYEELGQMKSVEFSVKLSFLEIYNEDVYDLLASDFSKLRLYNDPSVKDSIKVKGLKEVVVGHKNEVYAILEKGTARRHTAETELNASSSRSHTIFTVTVDITEHISCGEKVVRTGKLNLVDLAGSENVRRSGAVEMRAREAGSINQSLLTLGRVMTSLIENQPHIPYRESKLTRLLQESLGGHAKTSIIATISPALCNYDETLSTLEYAAKAKAINIKPEINRRIVHKAKLKALYDENVQLKKENAALLKDLEAARSDQGFFVNAEEHSNSKNRIALLEKSVAALKLENAKWKKVADKKSTEVERLHEKIQRLQDVAYANEDVCDKIRELAQCQSASLREIVNDYDRVLAKGYNDQERMTTSLTKQKQEANSLDKIANELKSSLGGFSSIMKTQAESEWSKDLMENVNSMKVKCVDKCEVFLKDRLPSLVKDFKAEMESLDNWITDVNKTLEKKIEEYDLVAHDQYVEKIILIGILKDLEGFFCNHISHMITNSNQRCKRAFYNIKNSCDELEDQMKCNGLFVNKAAQLQSTLSGSIQLKQFLQQRRSKTRIISEVTSMLEELQKLQTDSYEKVKANCDSLKSQVSKNMQNNQSVINDLVTSLTKKIDGSKGSIVSHVESMEQIVSSTQMTFDECDELSYSLLKDELLRVNAELGRYLSEGLLKDFPTGETPQKCEIKFSGDSNETLACHLLSEIQGDELEVDSSFAQETSFASDVFDSESYIFNSSVCDISVGDEEKENRDGDRKTPKKLKMKSSSFIDQLEPIQRTPQPVRVLQDRKTLSK